MSATTEAPPLRSAAPTSSSASSTPPKTQQQTRAQFREADVETSKQHYTAVENIRPIHQGLVEAFKTGITLPYDFRVAQLRALRKMTEEHESELADALYRDLHKNYATAYMSELSVVQSDIDDAIKDLKNWMKPERVSTPLIQVKGISSSYIYPEPYGVALIISPWNFPYALALQPLVGAIAAGCCACIKPSSLTCNVSHVMAELIPRYLDKRCYTLVEGPHEVTDELLRQKWDKIFFTGSTSVGKHVYSAAAEYLTPLTLELGGKSPCMVDDTANLEIAAKRVVMGKLLNAGQCCVAPDYCMVSEKILPEFLEKVKKYMVQFYGEEPKKSEDLMRIVAKKQFDRMVSILREDMEKEGEGGEKVGEKKKEGDDSSSACESSCSPTICCGGTSSSFPTHISPPTFKHLPAELIPKAYNGHRLLYGGGSDPDDLYVEPTVLLCDITSTSRFMRDEIFGPIMLIVPLPSEKFIETCCSFVTSRDKPLSCYLFSTSNAAKEMIISRISSGSLAFNECILQIQNPALPFGGVGESGLGAYHGKFSFDAFSHHKAVLDKAKVFDFAARYPPYTDSKMSTVKKYM